MNVTYKFLKLAFYSWSQEVWYACTQEMWLLWLCVTLTAPNTPQWGSPPRSTSTSWGVSPTCTPPTLVTPPWVLTAPCAQGICLAGAVEPWGHNDFLFHALSPISYLLILFFLLFYNFQGNFKSICATPCCHWVQKSFFCSALLPLHSEDVRPTHCMHTYIIYCPPSVLPADVGQTIWHGKQRPCEQDHVWWHNLPFPSEQYICLKIQWLCNNKCQQCAIFTDIYCFTVCLELNWIIHAWIVCSSCVAAFWIISETFWKYIKAFLRRQRIWILNVNIWINQSKVGVFYPEQKTSPHFYLNQNMQLKMLPLNWNRKLNILWFQQLRGLLLWLTIVFISRWECISTGLFWPTAVFS